MKRSRHIRLVLLGGALAATPAAFAVEPRVSTSAVYANDHFIPGAGYYHAPFNAFYPERYNHYDPVRKLYYYGGRWELVPHRSIVNVSAPTPEAARAAESARTDLPRGGFGSTSGRHTIIT